MKHLCQFRPSPLMEILESRWLLSAAMTPAISQTPSLVDGLIHTTAKLSVGRDSISVAQVGNVAIFAGGFAGSAASAAVDIYNSLTGKWSTATLSQARWGMAVATVGDVALFAGGQTDSGVSDAVDIYNAATGKWSTATLSQARGAIAATTVGNLAIFGGGESDPLAGAGGSNVVDIFNSTTGHWSTATLSQARGDIAATTVGNLAMFAGGVVFEAEVSDVLDIYNATTGQWTATTISPARAQLSAVAVGNDAIFAGGGTIDTDYSTVNIYNASTNQWSKHDLYWGPVAPPVVAVDDMAIFVEGNSYDQGPSPFINIFNARTGKWWKARLSRPGATAATVLGNKVLIGGDIRGYDSTAPSDVMDIYNARTGKVFHTTFSQGRQYPAAITVGDTAIFAGGYGPSNQPSDTVDLYTLPPAKPILTGSVAFPHAGKVAVILSNSGDTSLNAPYRVAIYASKTRTLGRGAVLLGDLDVRPALDIGQTVQLSVPFSIPKVATTGQYHLIAMAGPRRQLLQIASKRRTYAIFSTSVIRSQH